MILLPLEVLPGWPQPEPASDLTLLMLTVIGPFAFGAVVTLLVFGPKLARRHREGQAHTAELEPVRQA